jgi:glycolate oxidase iron-sulfur subunit
VIPDRRLFRLAMLAALVGKPLASLLAAVGLEPLAAMLRLAPVRMPARAATGRRVYPAVGTRRGRVALLKGCVAPVLAPAINAAAIRVLNRFGIEVVEVEGEGCCGAVVHHMGRECESVDAARANIDAWTGEMASDPIDAIVTTVSGCGTMLKDYGFMLRHDRDYAEKAAAVALLVRDISEYMAQLEVESTPARNAAARRAALPAPIVVAYHAACSLQHGQKIVRAPKELLCKFGFVVKDVPEGHLCCGSAGTYNMLQPELAGRLRDRKVANIASVAPDVIAAGNIGCITQIAGGTAIPVVHPVELIDWATGGPVPGAMTAEVKPRPA